MHYIKLDIIYTFNKIRIKKNYKWLTIFNSQYSQFEYLVMLFELYNAPKTFQKYISKLLQEYLNIFCTTYLDNVLIYSKNKENYTDHMLKALK